METSVVEKTRTFNNTDKLSRKQCADVLTTLLSNEAGPLVLAIDSAWGTGKTTFLDMWEHELMHRDDPFPVIRINTWETDYTNQPFASLIVSIRKHVTCFNKTQMSGVETLCNSLAEKACSVIKNSPNLAVSYLSGGSFSLDEATANKGKCAEIAKYEDFEESLSLFYSELQKFVRELSSAYSNKPVLLMVDELDRCRPTYAIEFLEVIKHLFSVEKLIFILAINKTEIAHSMKAIYGQTSDTNGYLRRFFDVEYHLPPGSISEYCKHVAGKYKINDFMADLAQYGSCEYFNKVYLGLMANLNLDLRTIEYVIRRLYLVLKIVPKAAIVSCFLLFVLSVKVLRKEDYFKLFSGSVALSDICKNEPYAGFTKMGGNTPIIQFLMIGYVELFENPKLCEELLDGRHPFNGAEDRYRQEGIRVAIAHANAAFPGGAFKQSVLDAIELSNNFV